MHIIYRPYRLGSNDQRILTNKRGSHSSWNAGVAKFSWAMITLGVEPGRFIRRSVTHEQ